jgi:hypothetical protein
MSFDSSRRLRQARAQGSDLDRSVRGQISIPGSGRVKSGRGQISIFHVGCGGQGQGSDLDRSVRWGQISIPGCGASRGRMPFEARRPGELSVLRRWSDRAATDSIGSALVQGQISICQADLGGLDSRYSSGSAVQASRARTSLRLCCPYLADQTRLRPRKRAEAEKIEI